MWTNGVSEKLELSRSKAKDRARSAVGIGKGVTFIIVEQAKDAIVRKREERIARGR